MSATLFFCDVTQCELVVTDVSGQYLGPESSLSTNLRCVTFQKSSDLFRIVAEAWNYA